MDGWRRESACAQDSAGTRRMADRAASPERSVLLDRISHGGRGQMPPLATSVVDRDGVELIRDWIRRIDGSQSRESGSR